MGRLKPIGPVWSGTIIQESIGQVWHPIPLLDGVRVQPTFAAELRGNATELYLHDCKGYEHWFPVDLDSLQPAVPAGYQAAVDPMEAVFFPESVPLASPSNAAARAEIAAVDCTVFLGPHMYPHVKLAWTAVLVTDGPTPMRNANNAPDFNQYLLESFADNLPPALQTAFSQAGWSTVAASIQQDARRITITVDGHAIYDSSSGPDLTIGDNTLFRGERWHRIEANQTGHWLDLDGRLDRYIPEAATQLTVADGLLGSFRQGGRTEAPFAGWATPLSLDAKLTPGWP